MGNLFILIAEDDEDDRFLLRTAFDENGFTDKLHFVEDGYELLEYLKVAKLNNSVEIIPHFVLLDLNMPKRNGREVLKEMQEDSLLKDIPVVVFSTTNNEKEIVRCMDLGAFSYVTKPVSFEGLINVISEIRNTQFQNIVKDTFK